MKTMPYTLYIGTYPPSGGTGVPRGGYTGQEELCFNDGDRALELHATGSCGHCALSYE